MVRGYVGRPGVGKTLAMIEDGFKALRAAPDLVTFTNIRSLKFPNSIYFNSFDQLLDVDYGQVLLDEAGIWLMSRKAMSLPEAMLCKLAQVRKHGLDLLWTSQHEARVDKALREITNEYCRLMPVGKLILRTYIEPATHDVLSRRVWKPLPIIFDLYDTLESIGNPRTGVGFNERQRRAHGRLKRTRKPAVRPPAGDVYVYPSSIRLSPDAQYCVKWLKDCGLDVSDYITSSVIKSTFRELLARYRWLKPFGMTLDDVDRDCSPWSPWLLTEQETLSLPESGISVVAIK